MRTTFSLMMLLFKHNCLSMVSSWLVNEYVNWGLWKHLAPHYSHANTIQMTAETTEQKQIQIYFNQTVFSSLSSNAAAITLTKSFSLLEHTAQHVLIFSKNMLHCWNPSSEPIPSVKALRLWNTWTEWHSYFSQPLFSTSVTNQLHVHVLEL